MEIVDASGFLKLAKQMPVIDVRSPAEYVAGHIPGAYNLALFDDEERKIVGTLYKNSGRDDSVLKGLELVGPKLALFVKNLRKITRNRELLLYCWRGGMRSQNMGWLFETAGYHVTLLNGGYKSYRRYIRQYFGTPYRFIVLGGKTGSGKTDLLHNLASLGEQVIDLEGFANHRGSVFGDIGMGEQPSNEQFENNVFKKLESFHANIPVWIEDESRNIGRISLPEALYLHIRNSPLVFLETDHQTRIDRLVELYSGIDKSAFASRVLKLNDRLGGLNTKHCMEAIHAGDYRSAAEILISYYDKTYLNGREKRQPALIYRIDASGSGTEEIASRLITIRKNLR